MQTTLKAIITALIVSTSPIALAENWSGEGSFSAGSTTGNTETTDIGLGVNVARAGEVWMQTLEAAAEFGEADGVETKNRFFIAGQVDRALDDRLSAYGRLSFEQDEFSGFDSRQFAGVGLGYQVIEAAMTQWRVEAGPGFRRDELATGETEDSISARLGSAFAYQFNENVAFTNDTEVNWADVSTQLTNSAAITATLVGNVSARASFDVRHDTNPPLNFEETDTATRVSLVYTF